MTYHSRHHCSGFSSATTRAGSSELITLWSVSGAVELAYTHADPTQNGGNGGNWAGKCRTPVGIRKARQTVVLGAYSNAVQVIAPVPAAEQNRQQSASELAVEVAASPV